MKQHITMEQFYNLSNANQIKLLKIVSRSDLTRIDFGATHKLFTIGKMIEILENQASDMGVELFIEMTMAYDGWFIKQVQYYMHEGVRKFHLFNIHVTKEKERCDALWFALKRLLEAK